MKWEDERRSDNVEDRRGFSVGRGGAIGGGAVIIALVAALLGAPPDVVRSLLGQGSGGPAQTQPGPPGYPHSDDPETAKRVEFVKVVLASTEDVWGAVLPDSGRSYQRPKLVLFSDEVDSACGLADAAVGPFYCPNDRHVYLDLSFFDELSRRFGAPGLFAEAYVVGHEVGHHVQNLLGIEGKIQRLRARASDAESNRLSVALELQADCFAGVWAFHANQTRHLLESGDVEDAVRAATAIGDDTLQRRARGRVMPETFTHGTSAQRVQWLRRGLANGRVADCDTLSAGL
ncbi:MAG TPA: neutral zinc metallopeptidase [Polyangia bacterium]|nr:neutral zinc metallopeptidase [Polyangia bacterium]